MTTDPWNIIGWIVLSAIVGTAGGFAVWAACWVFGGLAHGIRCHRQHLKTRNTPPIQRQVWQTPTRGIVEVSRMNNDDTPATIEVWFQGSSMLMKQSEWPAFVETFDLYIPQ